MGKVGISVCVPLFCQLKRHQGTRPMSLVSRAYLDISETVLISGLSIVNHIFSCLPCSWRVSEAKLQRMSPYVLLNLASSLITLLQESWIWNIPAAASHHPLLGTCTICLCSSLCLHVFLLVFCLSQKTSHFSRPHVTSGKPFPTLQAEWSSPSSELPGQLATTQMILDVCLGRHIKKESETVSFLRAGMVVTQLCSQNSLNIHQILKYSVQLPLSCDICRWR